MCVSYEQSGSAYKDDNQEENIRLTLPLYFLFQYVKAGSTPLFPVSLLPHD